MSDAVGQRFGDFLLDKVLGEGYCGVVYRASRVSDGQLAAVKLLHQEVVASPAVRDRLSARLSIARGLKHPGIAEIYDFGEEGGRFYIATELVRDGLLCELCSEAGSGSQPGVFEQRAELVQQAIEALEFAHSRHLPHLDIRPGNVLMQMAGTETPRVKLVDFGMSEIYASGTNAEGRGHPAFFAPEQWQGAEADERTDLYALGVLLYLAAAGELPFTATGPATAMYNHLYVAPRGLQELKAGFPAALERVILRCLAKKPQERYSDVAELSREWREAMTETRSTKALRATAGGGVGPAPERGTAPEPPGRRGQITPHAGGIMVASEGQQPGLRIPLLEIKDARGGVVAECHLHHFGTTIGSDRNNSIVLDSPQVELHHARVDWEAGRVMLTDLGSRTSTFLADHRLLPQVPQEWASGQVAHIGPYSIEWKYPPERTPEETIDVIVDPRCQLMTLVPGEHRECRVTFASRKSKVDHVSPIVEGIPPEWVEGASTEVALNPHDKKDIVLGISVPRVPSSRAGEYRVTIRACSVSDPAEPGAATVHWTVAPFENLSMRITPTKAQGRMRAKYTVALLNEGNIPETCTVSGGDDDNELVYAFTTDEGQQSQPKVEVPPGASVKLRLSVEAPNRRWLGTSRQYPFKVAATHGGTCQAEAQFMQLPVFLAWMLVAAPLAVMALLLLVPAMFKPRILRAGANPQYPNPGEPVTIEWAASRAREIEVRPFKVGIPAKDGNYRLSKGLEKETVLTVIATNFFGTDQRHVTVIVSNKPRPTPAPTVEMSSSAASVTKGRSVTITWNIRDALRAEFNLTGNVPLQDSYTDTPQQDQTYTITAFNEANVATKRSLTVKVREPVSVPPPKPRLEVDKTVVNQGQLVLFSWEARGAQTVKIASITAKTVEGTSGQVQARLNGKGRYTFVLVSSNEAGQESKSEPVSIEVNCTLKQKIVRTCKNTPQIEWR